MNISDPDPHHPHPSPTPNEDLLERINQLMGQGNWRISFSKTNSNNASSVVSNENTKIHIDQRHMEKTPITVSLIVTPPHLQTQSVFVSNNLLNVLSFAINQTIPLNVNDEFKEFSRLCELSISNFSDDPIKNHIYGLSFSCDADHATTPASLLIRAGFSSPQNPMITHFVSNNLSNMMKMLSSYFIKIGILLPKDYKDFPSLEEHILSQANTLTPLDVPKWVQDHSHVQEWKEKLGSTIKSSLEMNGKNKLSYPKKM